MYKKGKLIEEHIGKGIAPFGFGYKGRKGDSWVFEKQQGKVLQTISLYEYRFDRNMISFNLYTSVGGTGMVRANNIEGVEFTSDMPGFWKYEDKESFIATLEIMGDILVKKGMRILKERSVQDKKGATNEMYHELYFHHEELAEKFQKEHQIETTGFDQENVDRWFELIEERVKELQKGEYEEAKQELVEIAAFLGEQLVKYKGGKWERYVAKEGDYESCSVEEVKAKNESGSNVLHVLIGGYSGNGMEWVKRSYADLID